MKTVWKADIEQNECFKREIDITLDLNHDSVIKCVEIYEDTSAIHLVLELIVGGDLFDHIIHSSHRKLTENEAIYILEQILQALRYLHDEIHVVHRDIKPENFLMYHENERNKIKLIDFGFACSYEDGEKMTQQLGTPQYAAPEIFEEKPYTSKIDMWSTGIVLYNMINGTQPFANGANNDTIKDQVLNKEINFSGFVNPKLKLLCQHLLERDPDKRLNAIQALGELSLIMGSDPSQQTIPSDFNPDIHKIIFILCNDRVLSDELRNKFLTHLSLEQLTQLYKDLQKSEESEKGNGMLVGKTYLKAEKLINFVLNQSTTTPEFRKELISFKEVKGNDKIQRQMINATRFFITAIEGKKFIQKQRVWHEFKKHDKNSQGYITANEAALIFIDPIKRKNIILPTTSIDFEQFYQKWNDYEGNKIENKS